MTIPRLFGTDGVRGAAGQYPLDHPTVRRLGAALVRALPHRRGVAAPRWSAATRASRAPWIEAELAHGASGEGAVVTSAGIVPTPAVAYLTRSAGYDSGIVISASHNPFEDNGIKVFSGGGEKFTEAVEREVEAIVADSSWSAAAGEPRAACDRAERRHVSRSPPRRVSRSGVDRPDFKLAIDCANGATTPVAPGSCSRAWASRPSSSRRARRPQHQSRVRIDASGRARRALVVERECQMGVAFDGDGDRAIFVDDRGEVVNGDAVLLMCARQLQREGRLRGNTIVATVMSNIGLEIALPAVRHQPRAGPVGDKYVMEEMIKRRRLARRRAVGPRDLLRLPVHGRWPVHRAERAANRRGHGPNTRRLASDLTNYPRCCSTCASARKSICSPWPRLPRRSQPSKRASRRRQGRVLIRYSGTEPLLRVMLEGRHDDEIRAWAQEIVDVVQKNLGI